MPGILPRRDTPPRPTAADLAMDILVCVTIVGVLLALLVAP